MNTIEQHNDLVRTMSARLHSMGYGVVPTSIPAKMNGRLVATKGRCKWSRTLAGTSYTIDYSKKLFAAATPEANRETIIHEICHAFAHAISGRMGHDRAWKRLMTLFLGRANRCYQIDEATFGSNAQSVAVASKARKKSRYRIHCSCGYSKATCGPIQRKNICNPLSRLTYSCPKCQTRLTANTRMEKI